MTVGRPGAGLAASLWAVLVIGGLVGCAGDGGGEATPPTTEAAPATELRSPASDLRVDLTHLLQEHIFWTGTALATAVTVAPDAPSTAAAAGALDRNTIALSALIEGLYGAQPAERFLLLWRDHIDRYVDYTVALAADDDAAARAAVTALDGFRQEMGTLLAEVTGGDVTPARGAEIVGDPVGAALALAQVVVAEDPEMVTVLRQAAEAARRTALVLAVVVAEDLGLGGSVDDAPAALRAQITALQQGHVYLTAVAWRAAGHAGPDSDAARRSAEAVVDNAAALGAAVAPLWGEQVAQRFGHLWRQRAEVLMEAASHPEPDPDLAQALEARLTAIRGMLADLVVEATGGTLEEDRVAAALGDQGADLLAAAHSAGRPQASSALYEAAQAAPGLGLLLVGAIVDHDRDALN